MVVNQGCNCYDMNDCSGEANCLIRFWHLAEKGRDNLLLMLTFFLFWHKSYISLQQDHEASLFNIFLAVCSPSVTSLQWTCLVCGDLKTLHQIPPLKSHTYILIALLDQHEGPFPLGSFASYSSPAH